MQHRHFNHEAFNSKNAQFLKVRSKAAPTGRKGECQGVCRPIRTAGTLGIIESLVLAVMMLLAAVETGAADETRVYLERTGDACQSFVWRLEEGDEIVVSAHESGDVLFENRLSPDGRTHLWRHKTPERHVTVSREGNRLAVEGTENGSPVYRHWDIDDLPWYQPLSYSLREFLRSDNNLIRFWMIRSDTLAPFRMRATKEGFDTISLNGMPYEALKVCLAPDGWLAAFWHGYYWYRRDDGMFLKFKGRHGPPGTPITVVELVNSCADDSLPNMGLHSCNDGEMNEPDVNISKNF